MDGRLIWTDCDEAGYYVVPNVLSPRDLVSRPDNMDETVYTCKPNLKSLAIYFGCTAECVSDLVGNHEDRISGDIHLQ